MSQLAPGVGTCPHCEAPWACAVFSSIDADTIPVQVDAILDASFEARTCGACGASFRPEHPMLFVSHARRLWIVMHPLEDRASFASLEPEIETTIARLIAEAAPLVSERLRGIRPRLVFGQHMLTEAVRCAWAGLDAQLVEIAKLLYIRRNLASLMPHGPFELVFERFDDTGLACAIHALPGGVRLGELTLPSDALAEAAAARPVMQQQFPELFARAYASATRYLIGSTL